MRQKDLIKVLPGFGYQFLDQLSTDIQSILLKITIDNKNIKSTNISLSSFINAIDKELEERDFKDQE